MTRSLPYAHEMRPHAPSVDFRHRVVAKVFRRLIRSVERDLCAPGALPVRGIHRVLVCRPNHRLGNAVLISPLIAELERIYPGAEIDIVTGGRAAQSLFSTRFNVRSVICLPRRIARHLWTTVGLLRQLRLSSYDLAIDACIGSQSGRLLLAWVHARYKVGFSASSWDGDQVNETDLSCPEHMAKRSVFLLRQALGRKVEPAYPPLDIRLSDVERARGQEALTAILGQTASEHGKKVVGVFANATGAKRYNEHWWQLFLIALQLRRPDIVVVDVLAEHGASQLSGSFASFYTRDVRKLAAVIASMDGFISADCGVMHVASASGTPTYGLFSVTDETKYAPYGRGSGGIDTRNLSATDAAAAVSWLFSGVCRVETAGASMADT
ncbi:MAG: glycosyltransferase family 9 protein [Alphaproteobacteria bacterium]|nr:glycosyltransferase family 9 protein [Alphaproteobacteria bacterium]